MAAPKSTTKKAAAPAKPNSRPRPEVPTPSEPPVLVGDYALPHFPEPTKLADELARYLGEHSLVTYLGADEEGPAYIGLAGWQFVGAQLGQAGLVEWVKDTTAAPDPAYNYHARAQLIHVASGRQLGAGEAVASSIEVGLAQASANIVAGIAQNRALANAFYHSLGWLMRLAGIEAAPAELVPFLPAPSGALAGPVPDGAPVYIAEQEPEPASAPAAQPGPTTLRQAGQAIADAANANVAPAGAPMTQVQREEIIRLCNHPLIERPEKTKVHMRLNIYDEAKADEVMKELKNRIDKRENQK